MSDPQQTNVKQMNDYRAESSTEKKPISKRSIFVTAGVVMGLAVVVLSYKWYVYSESHLATDNSYVENDLYPVNSRMMGFMKTINIKENDFVKKGDVLAVFDDKDLMLELSYKKAKLEKAKMDFARAEQLIKTNTISKMDFEAATANLTAQNTDYEATMLKIEFTHILAAADGYIAKKSVQVGQFVQPGQSLFVIVPTNNSWVKANFKETQIGRIKPGMRVEILADALPGEKFYGTVESIAPSSGSRLSLLPPENATGNFTKVVQRFPVIVRLESKAMNALKSGMSTTTTVLIREPYQTPAPQQVVEHNTEAPPAEQAQAVPASHLETPVRKTAADE